MRTICLSILTLMLIGLPAANLQARMTVLFQQRDGVIALVKKDRQMMTSDYVTYILDNDKVVAKASDLQGQSVHILYYVAGEDNHCVDLRSVAEPRFEVPAQQGR